VTTISLDTFLKIGHNHKICEDYVLSGMTPTPYIIISDGCSSSTNTEMGARLLCYLAKQFMVLKDIKCSTYEQMGTWIINNAEMTARQLGLNPSSLDATLIVSYYNETTNEIITRFYGDGYLIGISKKDKVVIFGQKFTDNYPYYLSNKIDPKRANAYHNMKIDLILSNLLFGDDTGKITYSVRAYDFENQIHMNLSDNKLIMICSDGLESFYNEKIRSDNLIEVKDLVSDFTNFKNTTGVFLQRRVGKAIEKYEKQNIFHFDDLSMGTFLIEEEQEE